MQLLNLGIMGCYIILAWQICENLFCYFSHNINTLKKTWYKLGLAEYEIDNYNKEKSVETFDVIIPLGQSFDEFAKKKNMLEKAYRCKCEIIDKEYSNYVNVTLIYEDNP